MKMCCKDLKDQAMKIINYEKKEIIPLTNEEKETHENQKICYICKQEICTDENNKKEFKLKQKVKDHCHYTEKYRGAAHSICNLRYKISKKIPVVFHNGSTYDYHFIIKQLAREFYGYKRILNASEKILKNTLLFLYQLRKCLIMIMIMIVIMIMIKITIRIKSKIRVKLKQSHTG